MNIGSFATAVTAGLLSCCFTGTLFAADPLPAIAPLNPGFTGFTAPAGPAPVRLFAAEGAEEHPFGYVPGPVDYSYLKGQQIVAGAAGFQPVRLFAPLQYDLRTQGKLTPMRDQGSCGDCWAFAALGSAESVLTPGENRDFSENNLKNTHGFDWGHCDGGNGDMSIAYLARLDGPVNESDDPYNAASNVSPSGLPLQKILTGAIIIPPRSDALDNDAIKQAIMDYGAVQSSYFSSTSSSYYRAATASYYYNGSSDSNHAINLVGWDDNYDRNNFAILPPGNGAFIVRNSWGAGWGLGGYFYMSYYDSKIGEDNYQFRGLEPVTSYANVYQYDPLGKTSSTGSGSSTTYWGANIFTAGATESITAIGVHAASAGTVYDWYIYTGVTTGPRTGTLAASGTGQTLAFPGYHVVPVTPVAVTAGQKFSIVIKLTTPGYNYPIPMEYPQPGYSSLATSSAGQSYISSSGSFWYDITTYYANTNVALKAFSRFAVTAGISGGNGSVASANPAYAGSGGTATFDLSPAVGFRPDSTVTGTCQTGSFFNNTYTTGPVTGNCNVVFSFVPATTYGLTLAVTGASGSVSATPAPPGAVCPPDCSQTFNEGNVVTLTPIPGYGASFSNWSGACSGSGSCQVTMDGAKSVTASFGWLPNVKNGSNGNVYGLIGMLYDLLSGGETVMVRGIDLSENLAFSRPIAFTLKGGYDSDFQVAAVYSNIHGSITINDGSVTMENIVIMP